MGTEYVIFAFAEEDTGMTYRYKIDLFFIAFQGTCVSFLFCFMNAEVQKEVRKFIRQKMQPVSLQMKNNKKNEKKMLIIKICRLVINIEGS